MKRFFARYGYSLLLLSFLFVFASPAKHCGLENFGSPWCAVATSFQTFRQKETNKIFDIAKLMLIITRVAPECRDTARSARLCDGTLVDEHTYRDDKRVHENGVLGIEVPYLIYVPCVELRCTIGLLGSFHRRSRATNFLRSHERVGSHSWLPIHTGWADMANKWA
jgi:hypothetical protein